MKKKIRNLLRTLSRRFRLLLPALAVLVLTDCQPAKDALDVADGVCRVITLVDPDSAPKPIQQVLDVTDELCKFVQIAWVDEQGTKHAMLVPKELVVREATAYRKAQQK